MQSNEEKFQSQKAFLEKATHQLLQLTMEAQELSMDDADKLLDKCHTELTSLKVLHQTVGERQFRRVPHGVIPDTPITHHSLYSL